jgi:UDP-glucose 4-epimerase
MKAIVTGGAGFIGSHLVDALNAAGWEVVVIDDLSTGDTANLSPQCRFIEADAGDDSCLQKALPGSSVLFHLAAVSSVQDALKRPISVHDTNLTMTLKLLEACVRYRVARFVFASSAAVYGDTHGLPAREDMIPRPLSHYAVQKLASELYCNAYAHLHDIETVCLRYFNVYGSRQRCDSPYSGVISRFIDSARCNQAIHIFGDGEQSRDFINVADVARANVVAATAPASIVSGKIFNVGTGVSTTIHHLAKYVTDKSLSSSKIVFKESRLGEVRHSCADSEKFFKELGVIPQFSVEVGLLPLFMSNSVRNEHCNRV